MEFNNIDSSNYNLLKIFLTNVPSIKEIDDDIISNAIIALDNNKIVGCISYEEYGLKGLIRYFIFKNTPNSMTCEYLFNNLEAKIMGKGLKEIIGIAFDEITKDLFVNLGFKEVDNDSIYIDETKLEKSKFKNSTFLSKNLNQVEKKLKDDIIINEGSKGETQCIN